MKYIVKSKDQKNKKIKELDNLTSFKLEDFETNELYEIRQITANMYEESVKINKIQELKEQLALLGVDLDSLMEQKRAPIIHEQEVTPVEYNWTETSAPEDKLKAPTSVDKNLKFISSEQKISKVINKATKKPFTMKELEIAFEKFKTEIEKSVPEVMFCSFNENGFVLNMTDHRNDIPKVLQNGIPIRQEV